MALTTDQQGRLLALPQQPRVKHSVVIFSSLFLCILTSGRDVSLCAHPVAKLLLGILFVEKEFPSIFRGGQDPTGPPQLQYIHTPVMLLVCCWYFSTTAMTPRRPFHTSISKKVIRKCLCGGSCYFPFLFVL